MFESNGLHLGGRGPEVNGALQARESALAAARAEAAAASNALKTVETGINYYAARKEYLKLKDIAEASDVAGKVRIPSPFSCHSSANNIFWVRALRRQS